MKKILNIFGSVLLIIFSVIAFIPALITLIITDIREESRTRQLCGKDNSGKFSDKKATKVKQAVSGSYQFVADSV